MTDSNIDREAASERYESGSTVFGAFRIISQLGAGGMGVVYKAVQIHLDKVMALKVLPKAVSADTDLVRFQNEARALSKLSHPNVARVYDFGLEDGTPYLAMDYIEGPTLDRFLEEVSKLELEDLLDIFSQVASGLSHAHSKNIIHRDLKPSNIILSSTESGTILPVLVDFGVAKMQEDLHYGSLTQSGGIIGSPLYASPEQVQGLDVSPASDLYSLGCMMFHLVAGEPPFHGESALETMMMHKEAAPPLDLLPDDLPDELKTLVAKLLEKNVSARPESADAVRETLSQLAGDIETEQARKDIQQRGDSPYSLPNSEKGFYKSSPVANIGIALGALVVFLAAAMGVLKSDVFDQPDATTISTGIISEENEKQGDPKGDRSISGVPKGIDADEYFDKHQQVDVNVINATRNAPYDVSFSNAEKLIRDGKFIEARDIYRTAYEQIKSHSQQQFTRKLLREALTGLILTCGVEGDTDCIDLYCKTLIHMKPTEIEVFRSVDDLSVRANSLAQYGKVELAIKVVEKTHDLLRVSDGDPYRDSRAYRQASDWRNNLGDFEAAIADAKKALMILRGQKDARETDQYAFALTALAHAERHAKKYSAALKNYSESLKILEGLKFTPNRAAFIFNDFLGMAYIERANRDLHSAKKHYELAIEIGTRANIGEKTIQEQREKLAAVERRLARK